MRSDPEQAQEHYSHYPDHGTPAAISMARSAGCNQATLCIQQRDLTDQT
jgi:hypothetical protein